VSWMQARAHGGQQQRRASSRRLRPDARALPSARRSQPCFVVLADLNDFEHQVQCRHSGYNGKEAHTVRDDLELARFVFSTIVLINRSRTIERGFANVQAEA
jgi:hypothetical protein